MVRHHLILKEAPDALSEEIVVLVEDPAGPDVHQGLGARGLWTGGGDRAPKRLALTVLKPERSHRKVN